MLKGCNVTDTMRFFFSRRIWTVLLFSCNVHPTRLVSTLGGQDLDVDFLTDSVTPLSTTFCVQDKSHGAIVL